MAQFSESDINEAKKRVQEMRNRASKFTAEEAEVSATQDNHNDNKENIFQQRDLQQTEEKDEKQDKSVFIILALILLLSKEGADNSLILALLYLLL